MASEWVLLMRLSGITTAREEGSVDGALKCRRVVQVRRLKDGGLGLYARVPLPKSVVAAIGKPAVRIKVG